MHTTLCILIEISTYQGKKVWQKKVRAIIRRTATKDESYFKCKSSLGPAQYVNQFWSDSKNLDRQKTFWDL